MKLFTAEQLREWDHYTIENEPIPSIHLMERASLAFTEWFIHYFTDKNTDITIFCGVGNNGGDGLAIARLLRDRFYNVTVWICGDMEKATPDFKINLARIKNLGDIAVKYADPDQKIPENISTDIVIDALFGTGIKRPLTGGWTELIHFINNLNAVRVAVDLPSGMPAEGICEGPCIIADHTCSFQIPKLSFLHSENAIFTGHYHIVDIGLSQDFALNSITEYFMADTDIIGPRIKRRKTFDHKGSYGHCLVIAGAKGKSGAVVLSSAACLRSGTGLVTALTPEISLYPLQSNIPEAMVYVSGKDKIVNMHAPDIRYNAVAIGPGIGTDPETADALEALLMTNKVPIVLDADALNILSANKRMFRLLNPKSIITPHPKEFDRLFGLSVNSQERLNLQIAKAKELNIIIILKGAYTSTVLPDGQVYFNSTGNPGMATAGSGDVLTGIIGGLLAQHYSPEDAAVTGVFIHGLAGDLALEHQSMESLIASDIIHYLGKAYRSVLHPRA
jgi:ADP-dependent NAD(P)H-hydrate dehydratase / NAD(P)H-hydrate epimerase